MGSYQPFSILYYTYYDDSMCSYLSDYPVVFADFMNIDEVKDLLQLADNFQQAAVKPTICSKSVAFLAYLTFCNRLVIEKLHDIIRDAYDIGLSCNLRQLVDDEFVASCQQTCCQLITKTCYPQANINNLHVVSTSCNEFANNKLRQA